MNSKVTARGLRYLGTASILMLVFLGCTPTAEFYQGNRVASEQAVRIVPGGPHQGTFETFDLVVNYAYAQDGDSFKINGQATLGDHYRRLYSRLNYLHVYLFCLDSDDRVVKTISLVHALTPDPKELFAFERAVNLPSGATGIAFGYDGSVSESGDNSESGGSHSYFFQLPL